MLTNKIFMRKTKRGSILKVTLSFFHSFKSYQNLTLLFFYRLSESTISEMIFGVVQLVVFSVPMKNMI